jgi:hypothetical protein
VTIYRRLANQNRTVFGPQLARMLGDLGAELDKIGRQTEAAHIKNEVTMLMQS